MIIHHGNPHHLHHSQVKRHQDSPHLSLLYYSIKQFLGADHLLMAILKEVLLSGLLVDANGDQEEKREPASLMKQESKDGVQYNPLDAGALVEGGKVIGQNSFKMAGQVTSKQLDNEDEKTV